MQHKRLLRAGLLGLGLTGCTFFNEGDPRLTVQVRMPEGIPASDAGSGRRLTVQTPFEDKRPNRDHCGTQKTTYGITPGVVVCSGPPAADLAGLWVQRLRSAGYEVAESGTPADAVRIEGQLRQFFVEPVGLKGTKETDIHVHLRATAANGLEAEREVFQKGRGSDYQRSVNSAVRKTLAAMEAAVDELMANHPGLGRAPAAASRRTLPED